MIRYACCVLFFIFCGSVWVMKVFVGIIVVYGVPGMLLVVCHVVWCCVLCCMVCRYVVSGMSCCVVLCVVLYGVQVCC